MTPRQCSARSKRWAQVLNRKQDKMDLYFVDANSGKSAKVLTETSPGAWINVNDDFKILKSGDRFLWSSWRDGHTHLYLYSFDKQNPLAADAKLERQLTQGDFELLGVEAVDEAAGLVLFAANQDDPRQRHLFSVKLDGSGMQALTHDEGMHFGEFSDDGKHFNHSRRHGDISDGLGAEEVSDDEGIDQGAQLRPAVRD